MLTGSPLHHCRGVGATPAQVKKRTSGIGSAYGFGGIGKIIGPVGLALIVGSGTISSPTCRYHRFRWRSSIWAAGF
jgi:hypothetical protein